MSEHRDDDPEADSSTYEEYPSQPRGREEVESIESPEHWLYGFWLVIVLIFFAHILSLTRPSRIGDHR